MKHTNLRESFSGEEATGEGRGKMEAEFCFLKNFSKAKMTTIAFGKSRG